MQLFTGTWRFGRGIRVALVVAFIIPLMSLTYAEAQNQTTPPTAKKKQDEKVKIPEPEVMTLTTNDNVLIKATFYPGIHGKETIPVIMVHDWDQNRTDLEPMAKFLQKNYGMAVIIADLRGHGDSLEVRGSTKQLDRTRFKKADLATMGNDIEACRKALMSKNDAGELNIEMLTVLAVGQSNVIAVQWCIVDWSWPPIGGRKQGQYVKLLVMISPERKFQGLSMTQGLKSNLFTGKGMVPLGIFALYGKKNNSSVVEVREILSPLKKSRDKLDAHLRNLEYLSGQLPTDLSGTELVKNEKNTVVFETVGKHLSEVFFAKKEDFPWQDRSRD